MNDHKDMSTDFVKDLMGDLKVEPKPKAEDSKAFKVGIIAGSVLVAVGTLCLEGALFALVATVLGWKLTFLQGLSIAALFEFLSLRLMRVDR